MRQEVFGPVRREFIATIQSAVHSFRRGKASMLTHLASGNTSGEATSQSASNSYDVPAGTAKTDISHSTISREPHPWQMACLRTVVMARAPYCRHKSRPSLMERLLHA
jgi:hypothetical protein